MRRWRVDSLAARLLMSVLVATLVGWLAFAGAAYYEMRQHAGEQQRHQLSAYADMLWQGFGDDDDIHPGSARRGRALLAFALYRADGTLLAASSVPPLPWLEGDAQQTRHAGEAWLVAVRHDDERRMIVGEPLNRQDEVVEEIVERVAAPALLLLALLLAGLALAIHRSLAPLRAIDAQIERRAPDNLDPIELPAPREIAPLVQRLNALFGELRATFERERRFTADAAHELRTPLAALRVQLEIAHASPRPAARARALTQALLGVDRVTRLLTQLLDLARLDYARLPIDGALDLPALARQALLDAGLPCTDETLRCLNAQPCHGHAELIGLLLRNLLDNARRYAGETATVSIEVEGRSLRVCDDGPGVAPDVLERLGERFFRPPGQTQSGAGLGVSIVRRIAALHSGRLTFENRQGGGLCVTLTLPA